MTPQALAMPAEVILCETCCWYDHPTRNGWLGVCSLTGEFKPEVSLCGEYRSHERIKTQRRLNEHPRRPVQLAMGHHMGDEATCANHPRGFLEPVCGISWDEQQRHPTECLFPRPEYSLGRWTDPELAAEAARARKRKPADARAMDIAEGWVKP